MTSWFVKVSDGDVRGPFRENQIRRGLETGRIADRMQIRQGDSPWTDAAKVRLLFKQLTSQGFYLKNEANQVYGPFTKNRVKQLDAMGQLPGVYWIRHRSDGPWKPIHSLGGELAAAKRPRLGIGSLPQVPAAPVMKLRNRSWIRYFFPAR